MSAPSRIGSASTKRVTQSELWTLRDTVLQLQEDLLQSRAHQNRAVSQFDLLVDLVRKSWKGDVNASIQVARIVGVPPPENHRHRSLHHLQTTDVSNPDDGFLNSDSFRNFNESTSQDEQKKEYLDAYLKERQNYLDEQLALHDKQVSLTASSKTPKQPVRSLYRQTSATTVSASPATEVSKNSVDSQGSHSYKNSLSYTRFGLFDVDDGFDSTNGRKAVPRNAHSAVSRKSERPFKYETLRPISAGVKVAGGLHAAPLRQPSASQKALRPDPFSKTNSRVSNAPEIDDDSRFDVALEKADHNAYGDYNHECSRKLTVSPDPLSDSERQRRADKDVFDRMRARLARPESVKKLDEDLNQMRAMENSFRQKTLQLQQQLGITPDGMIY